VTPTGVVLHPRLLAIWHQRVLRRLRDLEAAGMDGEIPRAFMAAMGAAVLFLGQHPAPPPQLGLLAVGGCWAQFLTLPAAIRERLLGRPLVEEIPDSLPVEVGADLQ
jgi:hypothetical protein